ncbi:MAG: BatD family protein [Opitutales bacterium]|nr:BatD family protein [Opitutales bacterium]
MHGIIESVFLQLSILRRHPLSFLGLILAPMFYSTIQAQNARTNVTVSFEPNIIVVGQPSLLKITISSEQQSSGGFTVRGNIRGDFVLPNIPGLEMQRRTPSTQTRQINIAGNSRVTQSEIHSYVVRANTPGIYSLPSFEVQVGSEVFRTTGTSLEVIKEAAPGTGGSPLFVELVMPQEKVYVGETVKATVQIWVTEEISASQPVRVDKIGTAFAESARAQQFIRGRAQRDGTTYNTLSIPVTLTPVKGGLQTIQYQADMQIAEPDRGRSSTQSLLGSLGLPAMFNRNVSERRIVTDLREIPVKPLPLKGRPRSFTGAIGEFGIKARPTTNDAMLGEPIRLGIDIIGHGNFDRIQALELELGEDWRALNPESSFQGGDGLGYSGRKRFIYSLIPVSEEITQIPQIAFTFFDTALETYRTIKTEPIPVSVAPNPNAEDLDAYFDEFVTTSEQSDDDTSLFVTQLGTLSSVPTPLASVATVRWGNALLLALVSGGCIALAIRRKLEGDEFRKRLFAVRAAIENQQSAAEKNMVDQQSAPFLQAVSAQVRHAMGLSLGASTLAWTAEEIDTEVERVTSLPDEVSQDTRSFFADIEHYLYETNQTEEDIIFSDWTARTEKLVRAWIQYGEGQK